MKEALILASYIVGIGALAVWACSVIARWHR